MLNDNPIVDGFCYAGRLMDTPYLYQAGALNQLGTLRLANGFVPRIYAFPSITDAPLPNFSNIQGQLRVVEGSYLWAVGIGIYINDNIGPPFVFDNTFPNAPQQYFFSVRDDGSGVPIMNDWISESNFFVPCEDGLGQIIYNSVLAPFPLDVPRPILSPGIITVEICNSNARNGATTTATPQVLLYCAEPCGAQYKQEVCK